jgi:hypothetical protein
MQDSFNEMHKRIKGMCKQRLYIAQEIVAPFRDTVAGFSRTNHSKLVRIAT